MPAKLNLMGHKYGRLTVIDFSHMKNHQSYWHCRCDCGKELIVCGYCLTSGNTKSCGCLRWDRLREVVKKHDGKGTRLYRIWKNMRVRVSNKNIKQAKNYSQRNIKLCKEWNDFAVFRDWALSNGYSDNLTIDRINNDGDYCPENCRWATLEQQANNKSSNHRYEGKTIAEWSKELGVSYNTMSRRIKKLEQKGIFDSRLLKHENT